MARRVGKGDPGDLPGLRWTGYIVLLVLAFLVVIPLAALIWRGARPELLLDLARPEVREATINSLVTGSLGAILATVVGAGLAFVVERTDVPGRNALRAAFFLPFLIPPFIGAIGWMAMVGPAGYANNFYDSLTGSEGGFINILGARGIIALLALHAYPVVYLIVAAALRGVPAPLEEAARASGAGRLRVARDVTFPLILPALLAGLTLTFVSNLSDFGIPALLGLPEQYTVLPTLIYSYLVNGTTPDPLGAASALGIPLLVIAIVAFALQRRLSKSADSDLAGPPAAPVELERSRYPVAALLWALAGAFSAVPVLGLVIGALLRAPGLPVTPANLSLDNLKKALASPTALDGLQNSLLLAFGAAVAAGVLGSLVAVLVVRRGGRRTGGVADTLALLPQALPGTVIAVAWILAGIPLGLYNTRAIILLAYVMAFVALVVQAVRGPVASVPTSLEEAARLSGASPLRALTDVTLPLAGPAMIVGAGLVFFTAVRELTISALLVAPGSQTLGVVIFDLQQAGAYGPAQALALLVAVVGLLGVGALALASGGRGLRGAG